MSIFLGAIKGGEMVSKIDTFTKKVWTFKLVPSMAEIPRNGRMWHDCYTVENGKTELYTIYRTAAGKLYGRKSRI